jgi:hypothetical protein
MTTYKWYCGKKSGKVEATDDKDAFYKITAQLTKEDIMSGEKLVTYRSNHSPAVIRDL